MIGASKRFVRAVVESVSGVHVVAAIFWMCALISASNVRSNAEILAVLVVVVDSFLEVCS